MNAHVRTPARNPRDLSEQARGRRSPVRLTSGFTLMEAVGVFSILAVIGAVVSPAFHQQIREAEQKSEAKTTTALIRAVEKVVLDRKVLPGTTDWVDWVAPELDQPVHRIARSRSGCQRRLVYHPASGIQPGELGRAQTASGFTDIYPAFERLMVVSTLRDAFPENWDLESEEAFEALWNTEPHERPAGWSEQDLPDPDDLQIARLDLTDLTHRVVINNMSPGMVPARISVEENGTILSVARSESSYSWMRCYLHGTGLNLHGPDGALMARELINHDRTLYYNEAGWSGPASPAGPSMAPEVTPTLPCELPDTTPLAPHWAPGMTDLVQDFLDANFPCIEDEALKQAAIDELYRALWAYMDWAESGFVEGGGGSTPPEIAYVSPSTLMLLGTVALTALPAAGGNGGGWGWGRGGGVGWGKGGKKGGGDEDGGDTPVPTPSVLESTIARLDEWTRRLVCGDISVEPPLPNQAPNCSEAYASPESIWPPNHDWWVPITVVVPDPENDPVSITIDSIWQDEPVDTYGDGSFSPDGTGVGGELAWVRAERCGPPMKVPGNGRVYHIAFTARDDHDNWCKGEVTVGVPHDVKDTPIDGGPLFLSTEPAPDEDGIGGRKN